jgi:hypothetical protein
MPSLLILCYSGSLVSWTLVSLTVAKLSQNYVTNDGQSIDLSRCQSPSGFQDTIIVTDRQLRVCWCGAPSLTRGRVCQFTIADSHRQRRHSRVRVPRDSWPYFTLWDSKLHLPEGPGPHIYISQEQGAQLYPQVLFSSPPTIRRVTVEVFETAPMRG